MILPGTLLHYCVVQVMATLMPEDAKLLMLFV